MASITFLPGSVPIETSNGSPGQQGAPGAPAINANEAQNSPAPADTVVLTGRIAETQLNGNNPNASQTAQAALYVPAAGVFGGLGAAPATQQAQPALPTQTGAPQTPQPISQAAAAAAPANTADPAIAAAVAANAQPSAAADGAADAAGGNGNTPQQQLAQLDQTLQQLGIDPQSISLFNRMGMLLYANDPAALRVMVQEIQGGAQSGQASAANPSATQTAQSAQGLTQSPTLGSGQAPPANQAQVQPQPPAPASTQAQNQISTSAGGAQSQQALAQGAARNSGGAERANLPTQPSQLKQAATAPNSNSAAPSANAASGNAQTSNAASQFEFLQLTFSEFSSQNSQPGDQENGFDANGQGQTLNVTV